MGAAFGQPSSAPTTGSGGADRDSSRPREIIAPEARVAVNKGVEFLKAERHKNAIDAFTAAARRHPVNGQFRHLLGFAYGKDKQFGQAWYQFRQAVRFNPTYAPAMRDFMAMWRAFDQKGVLNVGRTTRQVASALGKPDESEADGGHVRWTYGFMQLNFVDDQLASVVDPRGLDAARSNPNDLVRFSFDDRPWWLSYRTLNRVQAVSEYVPQNQTVQDWTELFTVQRLFGMTAKQITPRKLMQDIHGKLRQQHPDLVWQVLQDDDNDMIYEWRTAGDLAGKEKTPAQHEIARLLAGSQDIHLLAYAKKVPRLAPDERQVWVRLVREATLTEIATEGSDAGSVSHVEKLQ